MRSEFSLAKNRPGVYFNNDSARWSVQVQRGFPADPKLIAAIKAAEAEFLRVFNPHKAAGEKGEMTERVKPPLLGIFNGGFVICLPGIARLVVHADWITWWIFRSHRGGMFPSVEFLYRKRIAAAGEVR